MDVKKTVGWVFVGVVGAVMLLVGSAKMFGMMPAEEVEKMAAGVANNLPLIGVACFCSGLLLLIPRTSSIGVLLCCSYWGGAICTHLIDGTSVVVPLVFLVFTWVGSFLRDSRVFWSLQGNQNLA